MYIDIGNTRVKIKKDLNGKSYFFDTSKYSDILNFINESYRGNSIYISSVVTNISQYLVKNLKDKKYYFFSSSDAYGFTYKAIGMGVDRLLCDEGALSLYDTPMLIIDAGSAVTIEYISKNKILEGGLILPGLALGAKSLYEYASLLPLIDYKHNFNLSKSRIDCLLSNNTEDAIFYGLTIPICTCIENLYDEISCEDLKVIISGGDGQIIQKILKIDSIYEEDLVFKGMQVLIERNKL